MSGPPIANRSPFSLSVTHAVQPPCPNLTVSFGGHRHDTVLADHQTHKVRRAAPAAQRQARPAGFGKAYYARGR
jgi:hypothetical protein